MIQSSQHSKYPNGSSQPFGFRRSGTGVEPIQKQNHGVFAQQYDLEGKYDVKRHVLKQGYSVGPSARSDQGIGSPMATCAAKDIPIPSDNLPRGVDIGNGYTIGYKELMSLSRLRKAGVETDSLFAEPKVPPPGTWTLG